MNGLYEKWKYATIILMGCGAAFSVSSLSFFCHNFKNVSYYYDYF